MACDGLYSCYAVIEGFWRENTFALAVCAVAAGFLLAKWNPSLKGSPLKRHKRRVGEVADLMLETVVFDPTRLLIHITARHLALVTIFVVLFAAIMIGQYDTYVQPAVLRWKFASALFGLVGGASLGFMMNRYARMAYILSRRDMGSLLVLRAGKAKEELTGRDLQDFAAWLKVKETQLENERERFKTIVPGPFTGT